MTDELIKCVRLKSCEADCAFKRGVIFKHLMNTIANIPHSDTVDAFHNDPEALFGYLKSGWWINCKVQMYGGDDSRAMTQGYLFRANSKEFQKQLNRVDYPW